MNPLKTIRNREIKEKVSPVILRNKVVVHSRDIAAYCALLLLLFLIIAGGRVDWWGKPERLPGLYRRWSGWKGSVAVDVCPTTEDNSISKASTLRIRHVRTRQLCR
jgi:hypothetical protein